MDKKRDFFILLFKKNGLNSSMHLHNGHVGIAGTYGLVTRGWLGYQAYEQTTRSDFMYEQET